MHQDDEILELFTSTEPSDMPPSIQTPTSSLVNSRPVLLAPTNSHISLRAFLGNSSSEMLQLSDVIKAHNLTILIDGGSIHNFIQDRLINFLGLPIFESPDRLHCSSYCLNVPICLGSTEFLIDLYMLPGKSPEVILSILWLKILGPIITD